MLAKEKKGHEDDWVRAAAEELGVDYESEEFGKAGSGGKGRGTGRKAKEKEARALSKAEVAGLRAELKAFWRRGLMSVSVSGISLLAGKGLWMWTSC